MEKENKNLILISSENVDERLDKFLSEAFSDLSRNLIQSLIKEEKVLVNGKVAKSGYKLKENDEIVFSLPEKLKEINLSPEDIKLNVVFEDNDIIVVNKSQGMITHPANGVYSGTFVNALLFHCKGSLSGINGVLRPGIVHRLDKETSGLIISCKNDFSHNSIASQIKDRKVKRSYYAIVHGIIENLKGTINKPIGRHKAQRHKMAVVPDGREAITHWSVIKNLKKHTLLECNLETGRTHQIRVHMASINHPIVGDSVYGKKNDKDFMMLHAFRLVFIHPRTNKETKLEVDMPKRFKNFIELN